MYKYRYGSPHYLLLILTYRLFTLDRPIKKVSILISCTFTNTYLVSSKYKIFFLQALSHVAVNWRVHMDESNPEFFAQINQAWTCSMCVLQNIWNYVGFFWESLYCICQIWPNNIHKPPTETPFPMQCPPSTLRKPSFRKKKKKRKSYIQRIETWEMKHAVNRFPDRCVLFRQFSYAPSLMLVLLLSLLLYLVLLSLVSSLYRECQ